MFPTLELAREFKGKMDSGTTARRPLSSTTVEAYFPGWLATYRGRTSRGLEETSRREYRISFEQHIAPTRIARVRLRDLGAPNVLEWLTELEQRGASPTTIRKARAALSVMLASALEAGDLTTNPAAGVRYVPSEAAKAKHQKRAQKQLTAADVVAILEALPPRWVPFFTVLAQSGVRVGELLGLTWRNVHLGDDPHILVVEQVYKGERKRLKTAASTGRVPLSPQTAAMLAELRPEDATDDLVFPSATGTALGYQNMFSRVLRPALIDAGIATNVGTQDRPEWDYHGVGFYAFRKACGSLLLANGKNVKQVQGWLRHARLSTTLDIYINQVDDGLGDAALWDELLASRGHRGAIVGPKEVRKQPQTS
ncbi:MAG: tyrosine-type recombinase/integrase [Solirubrobacteraceae bacterium]